MSGTPRDPRLPPDIEILGDVRNDPVAIVPPDPGWPAQYEAWRSRLATAFGSAAVRIDHVGSTAVPGLAAKPIVDIQVSVRDVEDESSYVPAIESLGLRLRSREPGHRYFRPPPGLPRDVQIHVCQAGGEWERDHLLFRDYLRAHPDRAMAYGALKEQLAARYPGDRIGYTQAKGPFIDETLRLAYTASRGEAPGPTAAESPAGTRTPDDVGAVAPAEVLAHARRVGPDVDRVSGDGSHAGPEFRVDREPEPWELPPPPPPRPRLREHSVEEAFGTIRELSLPQARAFLRAYLSIPRSELDLGGWARGSGAPSDPGAGGDAATLDEVIKGRSALREAAYREARASGTDVDIETLAERSDEAVVEALSHASLRGGGIEEATEAAKLASRDVTLALTLRPWVSEWRFHELVDPWVEAYSADAAETQSFDVLGALALALGVMALAAFGIGRTSVNSGDVWALAFAVSAAIVLAVRWRLRRASGTA